MLSFTATGMPYKTPDGCAVDACAASDLRSSLMGVRQAFSRLTFTMRSAAALALASASLGSLTRLRPRTARAWAPGRSRRGRRARTRRGRTRAARASLRRGGTALRPVPARRASRPRSLARRRSGPRTRESATSARPGVPGPRRSRRAPRAARSSGLRRASRSCALPFALEPGIGNEQLLGPDCLIVELHGHLELAARAHNGPHHPTPELAVPHALTGRVARRVLRRLHLPILLRGGGAPRPAPPPAPPGTPVPRRRRAALFECSCRQRLEEA